MGNHTSNAVNLQTSYVNDMLQASQNTCSASTTASVSGTVVVISGNVSNVVTGNAYARGANATCSMNNSVNTQVSNMIQNTVSNSTSATTGILGTLLTYQTTNDSNDIEQSIVNNISQVLTNTCQANSMADVSQNYLFYQNKGSTVSGNFIGYNAVSSQVAASCAMQNTSKIVTYNQASNKVSNVQKYATVGAIFAAVLAVVVVLVGVAAVGGALYYFFFKKSPPKPPPGEEGLIEAPPERPEAPEAPEAPGLEALALSLGEMVK